MWPHEPVLVVGAGPVGQTVALLLARWGVPSVLLERRPARDAAGSRAICQHRDALDLWEAVGAGRRIADEGITWTTARTFHRDAEIFSHTLTDPGHSPFPPFVNISQSRTEQLLDERIAAAPLVDLRWSHEVTGLVQDADGVTARTRAGELRGSYLVLCSGAHSGGLRRGLGIAFDGHSFDDRFLICDVRAELPGRAAERWFHFDPAANPGRQILVHPCPDSTFRIDWQVSSDVAPESETAPEALHERIRRVLGDVPFEVLWSSVYRFHARLADRMRAGRVLLAGDAAHLMSPFGARGLNSGVADAENAAWKIAWTGYGRASQELLETYHDERHAAARENLAVTAATMDFLVPPDAERARHRADVLARAAGDPAARALVDSGRLSEPFRYVGSPLTTPDPTRPAAGRPARGTAPPAAPGVLVPDTPLTLPDGTTTRLRAVARDGFLLLGTAGADLDAVRAAAGTAPDPVRVLPVEPGSAVARVLESRPGELWLLRPDAHVAAVLQRPGRAETLAALDRATARTGPPIPTGEETTDGVLPQSR
ncbi:MULTISPECIES: FAD-dependent monooxygenase [Pseudonocardia]|uniref:Pentachlorophenol 4-monooxygenase n=2 Tax=Pseudonocardia TaxID=1847 RepID=A0A1Y2N8X5_PSEAH|nr:MULTISPECIES: FAD-dependent monooxygenase [Pseudonocardia]OSY43935.1 Pentachlorophenol 4-monooxygenase [Pseudonocardia autotrophica]TDN74332.1 pentachlorophenol monooxygenase/3-(3-hydroxy-phenyl)propionate hydroxylase [Pseudonocardia autotrophica]BBG05096.1 oxidoreductase [Pseudonocardia autotrophica]GEC28207.1 oxidoreductase [Pseudonocardia saturnea]